MDTIPASILVVDDEIGMREGCRRALVPQGFQVSTAEHGAEGLRQVRQQHFDLILVDAMMPGMSGLELLEHIRAHDPEIICIVITGYATVDLAARATKLGAYDFLPKPFTSDELLAVVQQGLDERRRRLEAREQQERAEEALHLERARQEMAKLDAIESRFMLVIVHELRNPAGVIKNYLQMMRGGYVDADEWDEYLEQLDLRAGQLLDMLDDLLELANLKAMRSDSKLAPVAAANVLEAVIRTMRSAAEAKGLTLEVQIRSKPTMLAQRGHLQSLWTHLIDNAIRYTPSGGVNVLLDEQDGQIVSEVVDTGIGIANDELSRIFQEFYRAEAAKEEVSLGTGLGLPIVDQIVKIYGGRIDVDSTPGQGSTFRIILPARPPSAEA